MPSVIAVDAVSFSYGHHDVLDCVSFEVQAGEFVALAGPNGSGKSTLLRILLGLAPAASGSVRILGSRPKDLKDRWRIGYVAQRAETVSDFPATVREVVAAGRVARRGWWRCRDAVDAKAEAEAMEAVGVAELAERRLAELSGGQQQRVLIAKALASGPELLILDEPIAGVDAESQRLFRDTLVDLCRQRGAAVLLVSHEFAAVAEDLDRLM
ncbi:MAG: metal ABC transporter ATP-binding protein, partial [Pseudonocardiaceae bacterium]